MGLEAPGDFFSDFFGVSMVNGFSKQLPEGPLTEDPSTQESHPDHGRVSHN